VGEVYTKVNMSLTQRLIDAEELMKFHQYLLTVPVSGEEYKSYLRTHPIQHVPASHYKDAYLAFFRGCRMDTYKTFEDTYLEKWEKIVSLIREITAEIAKNA
jgi:hypothetical protein